MHIGNSTNDGHYIVYLNDGNDAWVTCSDTTIQQSTFPSKGYIFVYEKDVVLPYNRDLISHRNTNNLEIQGTTNDALASHQSIHQLETSDNQYQCNTCQKTFGQQDDLLRHQSIHIEYQCSICQKTFKYQKRFLKHQMIHTEDSKSCLFAQA